MSKPICLDLCGREGGAARGYMRAGFYVISVDIEPQRVNPADEFIRADGIKILTPLVEHGWFPTGDRFMVRPDLISISPPCQGQNTATASNRIRGLTDDHPSLVPAFRELADRTGIPYVIEQPTSSVKGTIRRDLTLCMDMFKGELPPPWVQKHRSFEISGFTVPQPEHPAGPVRGSGMAGFPKPAGHAGRVRGWRHGEYFEGPYVAAYGNGGGKATTEEIAHAMQIDWMTDRFDLCEAIPPAYSEYIGRAFLGAQMCSYCDQLCQYLPHADGGPGWGWRHIVPSVDATALSEC